MPRNSADLGEDLDLIGNFRILSERYLGTFTPRYTRQRSKPIVERFRSCVVSATYRTLYRPLLDRRKLVGNSQLRLSTISQKTLTLERDRGKKKKKYIFRWKMVQERASDVSTSESGSRSLSPSPDLFHESFASRREVQ